MRLSMFTMLWQQGELKAWLRSNSLIVSKLTFGSDVMSAYSSSEKNSCKFARLSNWKCDQKRFKNFDLTDCLDPGNARQ